MSSLVIAGDTSGTVTLQAPSVAGTTVLTLPTTSGTLAVGSSALTLISTKTLSSASSVSFTGLTGYNSYLLIATISNSSGGNFSWTFGYGATPTYITSGYYYQLFGYSSNGLVNFNAQNYTNFQDTYNGVGNGSTIGYEEIVMNITGVLSTNNIQVSGQSYTSLAYNSYRSATINFGANVATSNVTTAILGTWGGGTVSGTVSLYGISS